MNCHVFVDFDGTIATEDTTDLLLERFADPLWHEVEEEWKAGRIGSRECMVRQIDLIRATPRALDAFLAEIEIDRAFGSFVRLCKSHGFPVTVVSDGLDKTVTTVLEREGLDLPVKANHLRWLGGDRWALGFPHSRSDCAALAGNCKCQFADGVRREVRIMVGDGRSDFCVSGRVDYVLAKGALARHCRENRLPFVEYKNFAEARELFAAWLAERGVTRPSA